MDRRFIGKSTKNDKNESRKGVGDSVAEGKGEREEDARDGEHDVREVHLQDYERSNQEDLIVLINNGQSSRRAQLEEKKEI